MNFKTLHDAINWIETQIKFTPKTDLLRMNQAYEMLKLDFSHTLKIHVAGTNGKGSTVTYISNILMEAGYKVGSYISPYLYKFNERIKVNFIDVSDELLLEMINEIYDFNNLYYEKHEEKLSFFELVTLMAFKHFYKEKVDAIVIEVGLGGLLDATNILNYDYSIITNIGIDHVKQLGNSLYSIASNKLGILKENNILISTVDKDLYELFNYYTNNLNVKTYLLSEYEKKADGFVFMGEFYKLNMAGEFQIYNSMLAIKLAKLLNIDYETIKKGLKKSYWPGRLEQIAPNIYIDGAHNISALYALKEFFKDKEVITLFSALADKDIKGMLDIIKDFSKEIILTAFPDIRFEPLSNYSYEYVEDPIKAYNIIKANLKPDEILLITGSMHFIGYIRNLI